MSPDPGSIPGASLPPGFIRAQVSPDLRPSPAASSAGSIPSASTIFCGERCYPALVSRRRARRKALSAGLRVRSCLVARMPRVAVAGSFAMRWATQLVESGFDGQARQQFQTRREYDRAR